MTTSNHARIYTSLTDVTVIFGTINALFDEEEAALATYERAKAKLAQAEQRWCAMKAALVYERKLVMAGALSGNRLN
jgi:hypothetical protein